MEAVTVLEVNFKACPSKECKIIITIDYKNSVEKSLEHNRRPSGVLLIELIYIMWHLKILLTALKYMQLEEIPILTVTSSLSSPSPCPQLVLED